MNPRNCRRAVALGALFTAILTTAAAAQADITGQWRGTIAGQYRVVVDIGKGADLALHGTLTSLDQGGVVIPIDSIGFDGRHTIHFDWKTIGASFDGDLDGGEIAGNWQQGGARVPLTFRRPGAAAAASLQPVTRGSVALVPCVAARDDLQALCGTFDVYENRATRTGRKIALNVMILPALSKTPAADPVFGFAGGPGQAATTALPQASFIPALRRERDIVLIDQRGTGKSNPLRCPFDPSDVRRLLERPEGLEQITSCRAALEKVADLTQYSTANSSDDADDVRAALGYDRVNVVGRSYGSLAALDYLRRHESHVRAVAIEGIVPPDYRLPLSFAKTIQGSLGHLFADCAADVACHKDFPRLEAEFDSIVKRLDRAPAQFDLPDSASGKPLRITLSRGAFVTSLRPMLYQPGVVSQLPYVIDRVYQGDWDGYAALAILLGRALEQEIARGMAWSVVCQESLPFIGEQDIKTATAGTYLGEYDIRMYQKRCGVWPKARAASDFTSAVRSTVPTLLIAGDEDPATPTPTARHAAEQLRNSLVVGIPFGTHATSAACIDRIIVQFIDAGSTGGLDTQCVNQIRNPPFLTLEQVARARGQGAH